LREQAKSLTKKEKEEKEEKEEEKGDRRSKNGLLD
jgi:hypothetical protein